MFPLNRVGFLYLRCQRQQLEPLRVPLAQTASGPVDGSVRARRNGGAHHDSVGVLLTHTQEQLEGVREEERVVIQPQQEVESVRALATASECAMPAAQNRKPDPDITLIRLSIAATASAVPSAEASSVR